MNVPATSTPRLSRRLSTDTSLETFFEFAPDIGEWTVDHNDIGSGNDSTFKVVVSSLDYLGDGEESQNKSPRDCPGDTSKKKVTHSVKDVALTRKMTIPTGVWFIIFSLLPMQDLKEVMLTCKLFNFIGEMATLWKNVVLSRQKLSTSDVDNELKLLRMGKLMSIKTNHYKKSTKVLYCQR